MIRISSTDPFSIKVKEGHFSVWDSLEDSNFMETLHSTLEGRHCKVQVV